MPRKNMIPFEVTIYVAPEHLDRFKEMLKDESDECLLLDIERLIGLHLAGDTTEMANLAQFRRACNSIDTYGADVVEAAHDEFVINPVLSALREVHEASKGQGDQGAWNVWNRVAELVG